MNKKTGIVSGLILVSVLALFVKIKTAPYKGPLPAVKLTVNRSLEPKIYARSPLIAEIAMVHRAAADDKKAEPIVLRSSGGWTKAVRIEVKDAAGKTVQWNWKHASISHPGDKLVLKSDMQALDVQLIDPADAGKIPAGPYEVRAVVYQGKQPIASSATLAVEITGETPTVEMKPELDKMLSLYSLASGDDDGALEKSREVLQHEPNDIGALELQGDLLAKTGHKEEAFETYGKALEQAKGEFPPLGLREKYDKLWEELAPAAAQNPYFKGKKGKPQHITASTPGRPAPAAPAVSRADAAPGPAKGDLAVTLGWNAPVDVDLVVEDADGNKQKLTKDSAAGGDGIERWVLKPEAQNGGKYYAAAALAGALGQKADIKMTVDVPGKPRISQEAGLVYDGRHQFWIAFMIDSSNWEVENINAFDSSLQSYKKKKE